VCRRLRAAIDCVPATRDYAAGLPNSLRTAAAAFTTLSKESLTQKPVAHALVV